MSNGKNISGSGALMSNGKNILITYASGYGSTAEVAQEIGRYLVEEGFTVEVLTPAEVASLSQYDAVIVGSPIQYDRWMRETREFVIKNQEYLSKHPVAYFFNCLALAVRTDETEKKAMQYTNKLNSLSSHVQPLSIGKFAGVLDFRKMPILLRFIFKIFGAITGLKEGDYRDWNEIRLWAKNLAIKLDSTNQEV